MTKKKGERKERVGGYSAGGNLSSEVSSISSDMSSADVSMGGLPSSGQVVSTIRASRRNSGYRDRRLRFSRRLDDAEAVADDVTFSRSGKKQHNIPDARILTFFELCASRPLSVCHLRASFFEGLAFRAWTGFVVVLVDVGCGCGMRM